MHSVVIVGFKVGTGGLTAAIATAERWSRRFTGRFGWIPARHVA